MEFRDANSVPYTPNKWLSFDDVLLMPKPSDLTSRNDPRINLSTRFTSNLSMKIPILSANMDTVTESSMVQALSKQGAYGVLHRFYKDLELFTDDVTSIFEKTGGVGFSIGANKEDISIVESVLKITGGKNTVVCVDIAHGHLLKCKQQVATLSKHFGSGIQIIAGNVATPMGVMDLINAGANAIKVGVGGGSLCSTRIKTGHGVPTLTAIMLARLAINSTKTNVALIADGGIRNSGDIIKALAAGADSVMIGNLFSGTDESPGNLIVDPYETMSGHLPPETKEKYLQEKRLCYKKYRGQSSRDFLNDIGKVGVTDEGVHTYVPYKGPVDVILTDLIQGIRSGMSYAGATTLQGLNEYATFIEISHHGYIEGTPHGQFTD